MGAAEKLRDAQEHLSEAYRLLDEVGPTLPDLERGAVAILRAEVRYSFQRLTSVIRFTGHVA